MPVLGAQQPGPDLIIRCAQHARVAWAPYTGGMRLLEVLATAFFNTFGITQPSAARLRRATWYVLCLLVLTVLVVAVVGYSFYYVMHR